MSQNIQNCSLMYSTLKILSPVLHVLSFIESRKSYWIDPGVVVGPFSVLVLSIDVGSGWCTLFPRLFHLFPQNFVCRQGLHYLDEDNCINFHNSYSRQTVIFHQKQLNYFQNVLIFIEYSYVFKVKHSVIAHHINGILSFR